MISEPARPTPGSDEAGESQSGGGPDSADPHDPRADEGRWSAAVSADLRRVDRVPDQDEIPAQTNPDAMAKLPRRQRWQTSSPRKSRKGEVGQVTRWPDDHREYRDFAIARPSSRDSKDPAPLSQVNQGLRGPGFGLDRRGGSRRISLIVTLHFDQRPMRRPRVNGVEQAQKLDLLRVVRDAADVENVVKPFVA